MTNQQNTTTKQAKISSHHHHQEPPQNSFSLCAREFGLSESEMVRTVTHLVEDDATPESSEGKGAGRKGNANRSKHSETEQRRRSKINERFQILRDLIPGNDQKRDKASFLLEVIEYIQYLHGKLQTYEGSCHGWSPETTKLTPRRVSSGQFESFIDQSHLESRLSGLEDSMALNPTLISEAQNSVLSDFTEAALYNPTVNAPMGNQCHPLNIPMQLPFFESMPGQLHEGSLLDSDQLNHQSQSHSGKSCMNDCSVPLFSGNEEELKSVNGEATISSAYSQGLLDSLSNALQSSGVDMSQTNISVQLDIGKRANVRTADPVTNMKDITNPSGLHSLKHGVIDENNEHLHKRLRTQQN